jgi:hypothetical protein
LLIRPRPNRYDWLAEITLGDPDLSLNPLAVGCVLASHDQDHFTEDHAGLDSLV